MKILGFYVLQSREERKLAAIMKAFEKLEKQQERKKESQHKVEHDKPCEQEVEVKVKQQKVRGKGTKSEVKGEDIPPTSPPPPVVKAKEKKEKSQKVCAIKYVSCTKDFVNSCPTL